MTLFAFADLIDTNVVATRHARRGGTVDRWTVRLEGAEVKDDERGLVSYYGDGPTIEAAIADYVPKIRGRLLVFHATSPPPTRREVRVPGDLA